MAKAKPEFQPNAGKCNCSYSYKDEPETRCPYCKVTFKLGSTWNNEKYMHYEGAHWHHGCFALYTSERLDVIMRYATAVRAENAALQTKLSRESNQ